MSRLLILGATGSLGRHVLRQALAAGHEVTVFVRTNLDGRNAMSRRRVGFALPVGMRGRKPNA